MDARFRNQAGLISNDKLKATSFCVVGAGAIGSAFVIALSKMGARKITVYDFDTLEDHNLANQLYPKSYLGKPKVEALKHYAADFGDCDITAINEPWTPDNAVKADVVVAAVDNMDVRSAIYRYYMFHVIQLRGELIRGYGGDADSLIYPMRPMAFVDGRMGALVYRSFLVDTSSDAQVKHYESTLHTQAEGSQERCGEKSIIYTVYGVAGAMCDLVKQWLMNSDNRPTEIQYDYFNHDVTLVKHMEPVYEVIQGGEDDGSNGSGAEDVAEGGEHAVQDENVKK